MMITPPRNQYRTHPSLIKLQYVLLILSFLAGSSTTHAAEHLVAAGGADNSLARALAQAASGDTVTVRSGEYREWGLVVDKPLTIRGDDWPVINGDERGQVMTVTASNVHISGLVIRGAAVSFVDDNAGLLLDGVTGCVVEHNRFEDNFFAIYVARSADCRIAHNRIVGSATTETRSGNGIHLWYCRNIEVDSNTVRGHRDGIYFEFVKHSRITNNHSAGNIRYGLHFMFSDTCRYEYNTFQQNGAGVAVMYTHYVKMVNNRFVQNWGRSSYGLLLKEITDSEVRANSFTRNTIGVYLEGCNRVLVEDNEFRHNGWGVSLMANSVGGLFRRNNFIGNTFAVGTNSRQNFSNFSENYWTEYAGYDLDHDGFGDVPYHPVTLFSVVVQQNPPTLILLHSLAVRALNLAERLIPHLTPETLVDNRPAMEPFR